MIVPSGADTFKEALRMGSEIYQVLKTQLRIKYGENAINVGDEGGFTPPINDAEEAIIALIEAIEEAGLRDKVRIMIGGAQVTEQVKNYTGADAYGPDALAGVRLTKRWIGGQ